MKKIKILLGCGITALLMSSCTVYSEYAVTENPVGSKVGKATSYFFIGDVSVAKAAKNGRVKEIAVTQKIIKQYLFVPVTTTTVIGN
jgi:hypothetical protein